MINAKYGSIKNYLDVTKICLNKIKDNKLIFEEKKNFNKWFGDHLKGVIKILIIEFNGKQFLIREDDKNIIHINFSSILKNRLIIYLCGKVGRECFVDYIDSLQIIDIEIYYNSPVDIKYFDFSKDTYIFRYSIPSIIQKRDNIYLLNTEQLSEKVRFDNVKKFYDMGYKVIDYSESNLKYIPNAIHLPYQITSKETEILKGFSKDIIYDVCIVNCAINRRRMILNKLLDKGIKAIDVRGWKDERDKTIGKSKILLNVHFDDKFKIYESIRCDRWLYAGKTIISETSEEIGDPFVAKNTIWCPYNEIVDVVINTLKSFELRRDKLQNFTSLL